MLVVYLLLLVALCLGFPALRLRTAAGWSLAGVGLVATGAMLALLMASEGEPAPPADLPPESAGWDKPTKILAARARHDPAGAVLDAWAEARRAGRRVQVQAAGGLAFVGLTFVALGWLADLCVRQGRAIAALEGRVASLPPAAGVAPAHER